MGSTRTEDARRSPGCPAKITETLIIELSDSANAFCASRAPLRGVWRGLGQTECQCGAKKTLASPVAQSKNCHEAGVLPGARGVRELRGG